MLAVVATLTDSLISSACFTASTYAFVAASLDCVGSATDVILAELALITPVPFGSRIIFPSLLVEEIVFPSNLKLSTFN